MLADAQRAASTTGIERWVAFTGSLAAGAGLERNPIDNIDTDETVREYGDILRVPVKLLRDKQQVKGTREARLAAAQKQQAMVDASVAADGAKTLSETEVGGGQNALEMMLRGTPPGVAA